MSGAFRWTDPLDAAAIRAEHEMIEALNAWESEQRWRRIGHRLRDIAIVTLLAGVWIVCIAVWGRP